MTVLLVDDYADGLDAWEIYLAASGFHVVTAADGRGGLDTARAMVPDVVVLDLQMPGLSGRDVAAALRSDASTAHIPLIAATGHSGTPMDEVRAAGFDALIVKPCDPERLVREIRRLTAPPTGGSPQ